jgi:nucleoside-diphosphate-sugar epimerase
VALTGGSGFLGSHIADALLANHYHVRVAVRPTSDLRWLQGKPLEIQNVALAPPLEPAPEAPPSAETGHHTGADRSVDSVAEFVAGASAVIHSAGVTKARDEAGYQRSNVATTARLFNAARAESRCRTFILISSLAAAGPAPLAKPRREGDPCEPLTAYGRSKLAAEEILTDGGAPLRTVILRPPALYGPRDRAFLPLFRLAQKGWTARLGHRMEGLSLVDGRDAARAVVALLETESATGVYFVDDGFAYDWSAVAAALSHACHKKIRTIVVPTWVLRVGAWLVGPHQAERSTLLNRDRLTDISVPGWVCSGEKLRRETGFEPRWDLAGGFAETLADYREKGWLA